MECCLVSEVGGQDLLYKIEEWSALVNEVWGHDLLYTIEQWNILI